MKKMKIAMMIFAVLMMANYETVKAQAGARAQERNENSTTKIQLALLLDTSNSMDGLIEQAKSRLWDIVNTLTTLKFQGKTPVIEIALYEYGNSGLSQRDNYIRQVMPMTNDLDLLSEKLFGLRTNGGLEYCGAVIERAVKDIKWGSNDSDMKLVYIAGNESFAQGGVSYKEAISSALRKDIYINTIYCGDRDSGIRELWQDGAVRGKGKFFNIDENAKVRYIATPYDDRISECNRRLNDTYVAYGTQGYMRMEMQSVQDNNAKMISKENYTSRVVSKSKAMYNNASWDLVDKYNADNNVLNTIKANELPRELQDKSQKEIEALIQQKQKERADIQSEITDLAKRRQEYIDNEMKKGESGEDDLGKAITASLLDFSKDKGYLTESK